MKQKEILAEIAKLLEIDPSLLTDDFELKRSANWDSLTIVSILGLFDSALGIKVSIEEIERIATVRQLLSLTNNNQPAPIEAGKL